jgi:hypothetical protein
VIDAIDLALYANDFAVAFIVDLVKAIAEGLHNACSARQSDRINATREHGSAAIARHIVCAWRGGPQTTNAVDLSSDCSQLASRFAQPSQVRTRPRRG